MAAITYTFQMNTQSNRWFWFSENPEDGVGPEAGLPSLAEALVDFFEAEGAEYDPEDENQWPSGYGDLTEVEDFKYQVVKN